MRLPRLFSRLYEGVIGDHVPRGFWAQQLHPIRCSGRWFDAHGVEHRENR